MIKIKFGIPGFLYLRTDARTVHRTVLRCLHRLMGNSPAGYSSGGYLQNGGTSNPERQLSGHWPLQFLPDNMIVYKLQKRFIPDTVQYHAFLQPDMLADKECDRPALFYCTSESIIILAAGDLYDISGIQVCKDCSMYFSALLILHFKSRNSCVVRPFERHHLPPVTCLVIAGG